MRRRNSIVQTALVSTCLLAIAGCRQETASQNASQLEKPGPEESFAEIVELFENGMELPGSSLSNVFTKESGTSSRIQVHNTVTSQLIPPANSDDFYRGTITVSTQSIYSMRRMNEDGEEDNDTRNSSGNSGVGSLLDSEDAESQFQSFDQGLVKNSSSDKKDAESLKTPIVQRRPEKDDRTYELIYREGRWQLLTKLDPKTERSVAHAFDRALSHQP